VIDSNAVRRFWQENPVAAAVNPHPLGSAAYFDAYDAMREEKESRAFSRWLHEYDRFAGQRVLDVGCGNGYVLERYARAGARVTGVDLTEQAVDLTRRRFQLRGCRGELIVASAEALPFADASFDCVCSMGVLHHIPDTSLGVAEVRRVLRPGGRLITMFYSRESARYRLHMAWQRLATGKPRSQQVNEVDGFANPKGAVLSRDELRRLFAGIDDLQLFAGSLQGWHIVPRGGRLLPASLLRRLERRWGWFLYARGRRPAVISAAS
jgi:SAM-dependent methyltransferase